MTKTCPNCGYENPDGNEKCAVCNSQLENFGDIKEQPQRNVGSEAISGLVLVRYAAILAIVTFAISVALNYIFIGSFAYGSLFGGLGAFGTSSSLISPNGTLSNAFWYAMIAAAVQFGILIISTILLFLGFGHLGSVNPRLRTGRTGSLLYIIGLILIILTLFAILAAVLPSLPSIQQGNPPPVSNLGALLGLVAIMFIGLIIILVGLIMVAIGLYRIGDVFNDTSSKVGGILYFLINFVGAILLVIGISSILDRIRTTPGKPSSETETPENQ